MLGEHQPSCEKVISGDLCHYNGNAAVSLTSQFADWRSYRERDNGCLSFILMTHIITHIDPRRHKAINEKGHIQQNNIKPR